MDPPTPEKWLFAQLDGVSAVSAAVFRELCKSSLQDVRGYTEATLVKMLEAIVRLTGDGNVSHPLSDWLTYKNIANSRVFLLFDEAHEWLDSKYGAFPRMRETSAPSGATDLPRRFLSVAVYVVDHLEFKFRHSFWTGTALSLSDSEIIQSGTAGAGQDFLFWDFPPLDKHQVEAVLRAYIEHEFVDQIPPFYFEALVGRGRFVNQAVKKIYGAKCSTSTEVNKSLQDYIDSVTLAGVVPTKGTKSLFTHWRDILEGTENSLVFILIHFYSYLFFL